jgi:FkbM family methyltransferase
MNTKLSIRNTSEALLSRLSPAFHRYVLSCYQNVPNTTLNSGYQVLRSLNDTQSKDSSASANFLAKSRLVQDLFNATSNAVIFDVGANIGQTSSAYVSIFPEASLHAFEPFAENFEHLKQNTKCITNLRTHHLALSDSEGKLTVRRDHHPLSQWNSISSTYQDELAAQGNFTEEVITMVTGTSFCQREHIESIFLLKVDTEGHELEVLMGFEDFFDKGAIKLVLIEVGFGADTVHGGFQKVNEFLVKHDMILCSFCDTDYQADGGVNYTNAFYCDSKFLHGT